MVVTIKIQLTINGKFYATGPWVTCKQHPAYMYKSLEILLLMLYYV